MTNKVFGISGTIWGIIGVFAFNLLSAIVPSLQGAPATIVSTILLLLTGVLHNVHVNNAALYGNTN